MPKKKTATKKKKTEKEVDTKGVLSPTGSQLSEKEIAVAMSVGKTNLQLRAIFQLLEQAEYAAQSQIIEGQLSVSHGAIANAAGNYGALVKLREELELRIQTAGDVLMDREPQAQQHPSY